MTFEPEGAMISPKGNVISPKRTATVRGVSSGSLPGPDPNVVVSALVFLQKGSIFGPSKKPNVPNSFFHFSELRDFSRIKKRTIHASFTFRGQHGHRLFLPKTEKRKPPQKSPTPFERHHRRMYMRSFQ